MVGTEILTQEYVNSILRYDRVTGYLHWKIKCGRGNGQRKPGDRAGTYNNRNYYIQVKIKGRIYAAHRLIWLMHHGEMPLVQIDHINHVRHDNRLVNLRSVSSQDNQKNKRVGVNNTSGISGVSWFKRTKKWQVSITLDGKLTSLGSFNKKSEAAKIRKEAEKKYGFHPNHGSVT